MESHLHTLHMEKYNNEHKIIINKKIAKAICRDLYKSRLELKCKQIIMESTPVLKAEHRRKWMQQGRGYIMRKDTCSNSTAGAALLLPFFLYSSEI